MAVKSTDENLVVDGTEDSLYVDVNNDFAIFYGLSLIQLVYIRKEFYYLNLIAMVLFGNYHIHHGVVWSSSMIINTSLMAKEFMIRNGII